MQLGGKIFLILVLWVFASCQPGTNYDRSVVVTPGPNEPNVECLKTNYEFPEWFRDAKFGIYTHWGPVTEALKHADPLNNGQLGWYGMQLYTDSSRCQAYHKKFWGGVEKTGYKDIIPHFTADNFDAEKWADIFYNAGARFGGPVSTHHDNFFMWDSDINPYCAAKMGPQRDVCGEVATAFRKRGMKVIGTFHHGFSYRYYENAWQYDGAEAPELYWKKRSPVSDFYVNENGFRWFKCDWSGKSKWKEVPRDFQEYWRDAVGEFVHKYQPDLIWFDFGLGWMDKDIQLQMFANYYNKAISYGQKHPTVAHKTRRGDALFYGTIDLERGNMPRLCAYPWLSDTSPGPWFYSPNQPMQSNDIVVDMFVDIVAKNGCMLLSIGPDHTGNIPDDFMRSLKALGDFNKLCGEGIYNTRPWFTYGEGTTTTSTGHHGAANSLAHEGSDFGPDDIRYTQSKDGKTLFAFAMDWPNENTLTLKSVCVETEKPHAAIELFGYGKVDYKVNKDKTITINLPENAPNPYCNGFKISNMDVSWQKFGHYLIANSIHLNPENLEQKGSSVEVDFKGKFIEKASILLGSDINASGTISLMDGNKELLKVPYALKAGEKAEFGDFSFKGDNNKSFQLIITGMAGKSIADLAIGIQREHTVLQLGGGYR